MFLQRDLWPLHHLILIDMYFLHKHWIEGVCSSLLMEWHFFVMFMQRDFWSLHHLILLICISCLSVGLRKRFDFSSSIQFSFSIQWCSWWKKCLLCSSAAIIRWKCSSSIKEDFSFSKYYQTWRLVLHLSWFINMIHHTVILFHMVFKQNTRVFSMSSDGHQLQLCWFVYIMYDFRWTSTSIMLIYLHH